MAALIPNGLSANFSGSSAWVVFESCTSRNASDSRYSFASASLMN